MTALQSRRGRLIHLTLCPERPPTRDALSSTVHILKLVFAFGDKPERARLEIQPKNATTPDFRLYIAPAILIVPPDSS
jgi:hypothetical protein